MSYQPQQEDLQLSRTCYEFEQNIKQALNWICTYLPPEKQYSTVDTLKRLRRQAARYKNAAVQCPSVAIFGQSQVGKSYLVSNMARKPDEKILEILTPGISKTDLKRATRRETEIFDFIIDGNPPGKGKESTGFVTRFSIQNNQNLGTKPYLVKLFTQVDLVKVITNGYLADLKDYRYVIDMNKINDIIKQVSVTLSTDITPGFTEDDVYDLRDYLEQTFKDHFIVKDLSSIKFWDNIATIVPYIDAVDRWQIFQILWGHQVFFTDMFKELSKGLKRLGFANEIYCGLDAIAPNTDTIIDIERVRELFDEFNSDKKRQDPDWSKAAPIHVVGNNSVSETIDRSIISALAAELILPLSESTAEIPQRSFLKHTDILDFPGARSRKKIEEGTFTHEPKIQDKVEVFIRGKVAYLFDIYQQNFGISSLVFCMDDNQPNVEDIQKLIYKWIESAHGNTPEKRELRENKLATLVPNSGIERLIPLLFVLTKFNNNLPKGASDILGDSRSHDSKWASRLNANFSQYMTGAILDKWTTRWNIADGSFKNAFLLRDPLYPLGVYRGYERNKEEIIPDQEARMKDIEQSFLENTHVKRHFRTPPAAWQEATVPGKNGGIDYIIKYLTPVCNPIIKREQIKQAIEQLRQDLAKELCTHYEGGDAEQKLKKANLKATQVFLALSRIQKHFGQFLNTLVLQDDVAREIFREVIHGVNPPQVVSGKQTGSASNSTEIVQIGHLLEQMFGIKDADKKSIEDILKELSDEFGIDKQELAALLKEEGIDLDQVYKKKVQVQRKSDIYAEKLLGYWIHTLNQVKVNPQLAVWGLKEDRAEMIIEEMKRNMDRVKLKQHIADAVNEYVENFNISENDYIVSYIATLEVNRFVNTLGWIFVDENEKQDIKVNKNDLKPIFIHKNIPSVSFDMLNTPVDYAGEFIRNQWVAGIRHSFSYNVLKESNMTNTELIMAMGQLGDIIKKLDCKCE